MCKYSVVFIMYYKTLWFHYDIDIVKKDKQSSFLIIAMESKTINGIRSFSVGEYIIMHLSDNTRSI